MCQGQESQVRSSSVDLAVKLQSVSSWVTEVWALSLVGISVWIDCSQVCRLRGDPSTAPHLSYASSTHYFTFRPFLLQVIFSKALKQVHSFRYLLQPQYNSICFKQKTRLVFCVLGMKGAVAHVGVRAPDCRIPGRNRLEQEWLLNLLARCGEGESPCKVLL